MGVNLQNKPSLDKIIITNNDYSFIYTVLYSLYNLNSFKNFILTYDSNNEIKLGETLKKIFTKKINTNIIENSKSIIYIIKRMMNVGKDPGKIIIQILYILSQELENKNNKKISIDNIIDMDQSKALKEYTQIYIKKNNNELAKLFHGFLKKTININNTLYYYSFEYYSVIELNLIDIYEKLYITGRIRINLETNIPEINLIEAINETFSPKNSKFKNVPCLEKKNIYTTPPYLIFILNRRRSTQYYSGSFIYSNKVDLSCVIENKENKNNYEIVSIIKENANIVDNNNISDNINEYNYKYITINKNDSGIFYYYENNKREEGLFEKKGFYDHILIFKVL